MSGIVWLASYPKSGNTWVRILLSNYLVGGDQPIDINALGDRSKNASARRLFDEWVGVEASALDPATVDRLRPDVYRCAAADASEDLFFKVHDAWSRNDLGQAIFPADITAVVVCIVRNPLDTAVSCAHHWGLEMEQAVDRICDPGYCIAGSDSRLGDQLRQRVGSWSGHLQSWLDESPLRCHVVRYEDLHQDPQRALAGIIRGCGLPCDEARVHRAVAFSEFGELARQERASGFRERPRLARGNFFRRGEVGCWREELPAPLVQRVSQTHRVAMLRLGYLNGGR